MKSRLLPLVVLAAAWTQGPARADDRVAMDFDVEVPAGTEGKVYVALDQPTASKPAWAPDGLELTKGPKGHYTARVALAAGTKTVLWKVTRGDWSSVEKAENGGDVPNRATSVGETAHASVHHWADGGAAAAPDAPAPISSALVDLGVIQPTTLPSARRVVVYLPPGYATETKRRYPVLYVLDGQNQFDRKRSFLGIVWALDKAADAHVAAGHEAFVAVAIDNTPERADEYLPSQDVKRKGGGRLEDLAKFIFQELKPKIDARFRTKTGPDDTGILGSSFGGMAAFHLGWKHPDKVRRVGSVSPSLWWNKRETEALVLATKAKPQLRIWLDMGTKEGQDEGDSAPYVETARGVKKALEGLGFTLGKDLGYMEAEGAVHNEGAWQARLPEILRFLFP